jgi:hypothetical protein
MGILKKTLFAAVAAKAIDIGRRPETRRRAKEFVAARRKSRSPGT